MSNTHTLEHYGRLMGEVSVVSMCITIPVTLAVLLFALLAVRSQPRAGAILIAAGCLLSLLLTGFRTLMPMMINMQTQMDLYFKLQIVLGFLGIVYSLLMGSGIILVLCNYIIAKVPRSRSDTL